MKNNNSFWTKSRVFVIVILFCSVNVRSQFLENFEKDEIVFDLSAKNGWSFYSGDGNASISFAATKYGYAKINVDATKDTRNIWWAVIRRCVSENLPVDLLKENGFEIRIETRIRVSDAPKRVNLSLNSESMTDFHSNLMEFDIPDTTDWHIISFTTTDFEVNEGVQLCLHF